MSAMDTEAEEPNRVAVLMAVPQYPPPTVGGLEQQAWRLSQQLAADGYSVTVLSGDVDGGCAEPEGAPVRVIRMRWEKSAFARACVLPLRMLRFFWRLRAQWSVAHAHVFSGFGLGIVILSGLFRRPVLVKLPGVGEDGVLGMRRQFLGRARQRLLLRADAIVAMSTESIRELVAVGYDPRHILVTPNGVVVTDPGSDTPVRRESCSRLVFVGRLHEPKGIVDLIDALSTIDPRFDWTLDLIGDGELRDPIARKLDGLGLNQRIRFVGRCDHVQQRLFEYDALVLPSYREGNSNAILEAMVAGLPIISTRVGGTPMLVGPEGAPLLHEPRDVAALATLLRDLIGDPATARRLGQAMRTRVETCFDMRQIAKTYEAAYRLLAAGRKDEIHTLANPAILWPEEFTCVD